MNERSRVEDEDQGGGDDQEQADDPDAARATPPSPARPLVAAVLYVALFPRRSHRIVRLRPKGCREHATHLFEFQDASPPRLTATGRSAKPLR